MGVSARDGWARHSLCIRTACAACCAPGVVLAVTPQECGGTPAEAAAAAGLAGLAHSHKAVWLGFGRASGVVGGTAGQHVCSERF